MPALCTNQSCNRQRDTQCAGHCSSDREFLHITLTKELTQIKSNSAVLEVYINHLQGFLLWKFWSRFTLKKQGRCRRVFLYTIRGHVFENAMASNQHSQQGRSTCTVKYARNVVIFTQVYVRRYSCLTSKTNTKGPFVSGFSPDFIHRNIQNSLDGQLKLFSVSVLGLKQNSGHNVISFTSFVVQLSAD